MADDDLPPAIQKLVDRMDRDPEVRAAIKDHLLRQRDLGPGLVRLADDRVVEIGEAPET